MNEQLEHATDPESMSKAELQAEARARGLSDGGKKDSLLRRIQEHDGGSTEAPTGTGDGEQPPEATANAATTEESAHAGQPDTPEGRSEPAEEPAAGGDAAAEGPQAEAATAPTGQPDDHAQPAEQPAEASGGRGTANEDRQPETATAATGQPDDHAQPAGEPPGPEAHETPAEPAGELERRGEGDADREDREGGDGAVRAGGRDGMRLDDLARVADSAVQSVQRAERQLNSVSGVHVTEHGYRVTIDVLEFAQEPTTTGVLATYEVDIDGDGNVTGYTRTPRHYHSQVIGG